MFQPKALCSFRRNTTCKLPGTTNPLARFLEGFEKWLLYSISRPPAGTAAAAMPRARPLRSSHFRSKEGPSGIPFASLTPIPPTPRAVGGQPHSDPSFLLRRASSLFINLPAGDLPADSFFSISLCIFVGSRQCKFNFTDGIIEFGYRADSRGAASVQ